MLLSQDYLASSVLRSPPSHSLEFGASAVTAGVVSAASTTGPGDHELLEVLERSQQLHDLACQRDAFDHAGNNFADGCIVAAFNSDWAVFHRDSHPDDHNPTGYAQVVDESFGGSSSGNRELNHRYVYGL